MTAWDRAVAEAMAAVAAIEATATIPSADGGTQPETLFSPTSAADRGLRNGEAATHPVTPRRGISSRRRRAQIESEIAKQTRSRYGITTHGAYRHVIAWRSRAHWRREVWTALHTDHASTLRSAVGKRGCVSIKSCYIVALAVSTYADGRTGRNALPGMDALTSKPRRRQVLDLTDPHHVDLIVRTTCLSLSTVQKAITVLSQMGYVRLIRTGKNRLSLADRLEIHASKSKARSRRAVWACTLPRPAETAAPSTLVAARPCPQPAPANDAAGEAVDNYSPANTGPTDGCTLPTTRSVSGKVTAEKSNYLQPKQSNIDDPSGRAPTRAALGKRTNRYDPRYVKLVKDLQVDVYWLRGLRLFQLRVLEKFAAQDWSASDIRRALDQLLAARKWSVPTSTATGPGVRNPVGYLTSMLSHIDPSELAIDKAYESWLRQTSREYEQLLRTGPQCPHGQPGGNTPAPLTQVFACSQCRPIRRQFRPSPGSQLATREDAGWSFGPPACFATFQT